MSLDGRRRRYVPLDVDLAFGTFGSRLGERWGVEGLGCWMLFLAACKREHSQGTFSYRSEDDAWTRMGARPSGFTLDEFFRFTGDHKKTRRTRHGRLTYVTCTSWEDWNKPRGSRQNTSKPVDSNGEMRESVAEMREDVAPEVGSRSRNFDTEGESRPTGLPFENELLLARLLHLCEESFDEGTEHVLRSYAAKVAPSSLSKVIETTSKQPAATRSQYANGALKSEIRERRLAS